MTEQAAARLRAVKMPPSPADRAALEVCMTALNDFERTLDDNREVGAAMAADHIEALVKEVARAGGGMILAEDQATATGGGPCGFIVYAMQTEFGRFVAPQNQHYGLISDLWVAPRARRQGVAQALIAAAEEGLLTLGAGRIEVGALWDNAGARALYAAAGYAPSAVTMVKRVAPPGSPAPRPQPPGAR
ncbi:MAG: GNAT family N-acetyltransferase [Pseudomonadota bacterium]